MADYPRITLSSADPDAREEEIFNLINERIPANVLEQLTEADIGHLVDEWSEKIEEQRLLFNDLIQSLVKKNSVEVFLRLADAMGDERKRNYH